jgi:hypothetical protein
VWATRRIFKRVRKIGKRDYELRHACASVRPAIRMEQLGSHWTGSNDTGAFFFENLLRNFKFNENLTRITGISHEDH